MNSAWQWTVAERRPDAVRTWGRLIVSLLPPVVLAMLLPHDRYADYDPVLFRPLIEFQTNLTAGFILGLLAIAMFTFAVWQTSARSPLLDKGSMGWLAIHGWNGDQASLPQRGILPKSEIAGVLLISLCGSWFAGMALVLLPMIWSLVRLAAGAATHAPHHPYPLGVVLILHASVILLADRIWVCLPMLLVAIILSEHLNMRAIRRKANSLMEEDVSLAAKPTAFAQHSHREQRQRGTPRSSERQLFPFWQLRPQLTDNRLNWNRVVWYSVTLAWIMFCVASRIAAKLQHFEPATNQPPVHAIICFGVMWALFASGLLVRSVLYAPLLWLPRIGPISRLRQLKPIVWSWDRVWLPLMLPLLLLIFPMLETSMMSPIGLSLLTFAESILLFRIGPAPNDWQMTSDARLSSAFFTNSH